MEVLLQSLAEKLVLKFARHETSVKKLMEGCDWF
jgi:hypothetical protein